MTINLDHVITIRDLILCSLGFTGLIIIVAIIANIIDRDSE